MLTAKQRAEVAAQHGVSVGTVDTLIEGLARTGGAAVQFNLPELGGMGQWMPGMVMTPMMDGHILKAKVDALCSQLAGLVRDGAISRGAIDEDHEAHDGWWPDSYPRPDSTGGQNDVRYAYFAHSNRLLVERAGVVTAYDTTGHIVFGAGQQQGGGASKLTLSTDVGMIPLESLPTVTD